MRPVIALVGRPNVGKSTLFNRLTRSRDALVADLPGLTRDRRYGQGSHEGKSFIVIDTGGITGHEEGIDQAMAAQSLQAMDEAGICLLLVDARDGLTPDDEQIADYLRRRNKPGYLVVNKVDGLDPDQAGAEFFSLGLPGVFPVTATEGRGVSRMLEEVLEETAADADGEDDGSRLPDGVRIAIAGRPNVGKSTLVNRMLGEERVVVYDQPGTTRDSVRIPFERRGRQYVLIDTAGIRRRGKTRQTVEKFSVVDSLQAIQDAHVVIILVDARDGIVEQDLHLLGYVIDSGRALVIAINKWDGLTDEDKKSVKSEIQRRFTFLDFASIHFISALHGTGVGKLYPAIHKAYESAHKQLSTHQLTQVLQRAVRDHAPPLVNNRRIKLRYAHPGGQNPPTIVIHGKQTGKLPRHYCRYLEKTFRKLLQLEGTPVRIEPRSDANPFAEQRRAAGRKQPAGKRGIKQHKQARQNKPAGKTGNTP